MKRFSISALFILSLLNLPCDGYATDGFPGSCLNFPHTGYPWAQILPSPSQSLYPGTDFTVMGWFKAPMQTRGYDGILVGVNTPSDGNDFVIYLDDVTGACSYWQTGGNGITSSQNVSDLKWHHFAVSRQGSTMRLYVDGEYAGSVTSSWTLGQYDPWSLGQEWDAEGSSQWYEGQLDEISLWDHHLPEAEIHESMHLTLNGNEAGLISYWQFNEGSGSWGYDAAGPHDVNLLTGVSWVNSTALIGAGFSATQTVNGTGNYPFNGTGLELYYTNPTSHTVVVSRLDIAPNREPSGEMVFDTQYWIIRQFNGSGIADEARYTVNETLFPEDQADPTRIRLYSREINDSGPWSLADAEAECVDPPAGELCFDVDHGQGQYLISRFDPPVLVSRWPEPGATEIPIDAVLTLEFDRPVSAGPGGIVILNEGHPYWTFPPDSFQIDNNIVSCNLWGQIWWLDEYELQVEPDAFHDGNGSYWADDLAGTWTFTTFSKFSESGSDLHDFSTGDLDWGDFDLDGDLDILLAGSYGAKVYRNDAGLFTDIEAGLTAVSEASVEWGDLDNDGDPDILLSGIQTGGIFVTVVYRNDDGAFVDAQVGLPATCRGNATWGDYDRDGDQDILLYGVQLDYLCRVQLYRNDGGLFTNVSLGDCQFCDSCWDNGAITWIDFDEDGDLDIIFGGTQSGVITFYLLENQPGGFLQSSLPEIAPFLQPTVDFADRDYDGDLDLLITGINLADIHQAPSTHIYNRTEMGYSQEIWGHDILGVVGGAGTFVDYDNSLSHELLLTGYQGGEFWGWPATRLYAGEQWQFTIMPDLMASSATWGDYDHDDDLDLLLAGIDIEGTEHAHVYRNNSYWPNENPLPPTNLQVSYLAGELILSWDPGSDQGYYPMPPIALSYNCYLSDTPGGSNLLSPLADTDTGLRYLTGLGNVGQGTSHTLLLDLPDDIYYWSVQSVDQNYAGSSFAPEQSFTVGTPGLDPPQNLTIIIAEEQLQLRWDPVNLAQSYRVLAASEAYGPFNDVTIAGVFETPETWVTTEPEAASMFYQIVASTEPGS